MLVVAHRGANREALENSWSAFEKAVACGSQRIELDVQLSQDGTVFVLHDDDLYRTVGINGLLSSKDSRELGKLKLRNGEKIPRLDEVLHSFLNRIEFNIEFKGNDPRLVTAVGKLTQNLPLRDRLIFSSFFPNMLDRLALDFPSLRRAVLWGQYTLKAAPQYRFAPQLFMHRADSTTIHPQTDLVTERFMDQAFNRGWTVIPYATMNGEEHGKEFLWTKLRALGVEGLCTNYPREMKQWLQQFSPRQTAA